METTRIEVSNQTVKVRQINDIVKREGRFDDSLMVFNNVKREIISKIKDPKSPASDVLGLLYGANIVGVDREPPRFFKNKQGKARTTLFKHKARKFDADTYYYHKTKDNNFLTRHKNVTNNSIELGKEFSNQSQHFLNKLEIENYVRTKEMVRTFNNGRILIDIRKPSGRQLKLSKEYFV